jgi:hypothetical protein
MKYLRMEKIVYTLVQSDNCFLHLFEVVIDQNTCCNDELTQSVQKFTD